MAYDSKSYAADTAAAPSYDQAYEEDRRGSVTEPQVGELAPGEAEAGGLGRHLGVWSTMFLIIGRIIGTGIFSTPSTIVQSVGSVGAAFMLWLLGLAIAFSGLCIWLELGCMIPRSGGEKVYLETMYRRPKLLATVVFAVYAIVLGFTASACKMSTGIPTPETRADHTSSQASSSLNTLSQHLARSQQSGSSEA